jgi:hypothetical protein
MSSYEQKITELANRIARIDEEVASVDQSFLELASQFSGVDGQASLKQAALLETKLNELKRERSLAEAARQQAEDAIKHDQIVREQEEHRALAAQTKEVSSAVCVLNAELDEKLFPQLVQAIERRAALLHELGSLGVSSGVLAKLAKPALTRAACFHGLAKWIDINRCAPSSLCTLASTNAVLGIGKLNGGGHD